MKWPVFDLSLRNPVIRSFYIKERYCPTFLSILTNDYYIVRARLYTGIWSNRRYMSGVLLDFGCGMKPYRHVFEVDEYIGLDIAASGHIHTHDDIDCFYDGKAIPFGSCSFDSVFSSEVFEHVFNLDTILSEIHRVMKPGAHLLFTIPFAWCEHEMPYDFARYTSSGIKSKLEAQGFVVLDIQKSSTFVEAVFQNLASYVSNRLRRFSPLVRLLLTPLLVAPFLVFGVALSKVLPKDASLFLNLIVLAKRSD